MTEIVVLYILWHYDATVYKISKIVNERFFAFLKSSLGTINPTVKKLQKMGCLEVTESMTQAGFEKKMCSITPFGKKYLKELLLNLEFNNPAHLLNNIKIAVCCKEILSNDEVEDFISNIENHLIYFKGKVQQGLENPYISFNSEQKNMIEATIKEAEEILGRL